MNYQLQCECGALRAEVSHVQHAARGVCYCKDCRAYVHHLGKASEVLDAQGGIAFIATQAPHIRFTQGVEQLACLSHSPKGLLRWYAKCCNTPLCNTVRNWKFPYVGVIHARVKTAPDTFATVFPEVQMRVNTESALAAPPPMRWKTMRTLFGVMARTMGGSLSGTYRGTPFFTGPQGTPVVAVELITPAARAQAYQKATGQG